MKIEQLQPASCDGKAPKGEVVAEEKIDGHRGLLHIGQELDRGYLTGRRVSKKTGVLTEKGENVPSITQTMHTWSKFAKLGYTVLDGEVTILGEPFESVQSVMGGHPDTAAAWLRANDAEPTYHVFDVLIYNGEDMRELAWADRQVLLDRVMLDTRAAGASQIQRVLAGRPDDLFEEIVSAGGEGVVLKDSAAPYGRGWTKRKKAMTFDVVITGFTEGNGKFEGLVGAVQYGVWTNDQVVEIGQCSGMSDGDTQWVNGLTGQPCTPNSPHSRIIPIDVLTPQQEGTRLWFSAHRNDLVGQVMEVRANGVTRHGRLRHPQFVRLRKDKKPQQCLPALQQT